MKLFYIIVGGSFTAIVIRELLRGAYFAIKYRKSQYKSIAGERINEPIYYDIYKVGVIGNDLFIIEPNSVVYERGERLNFIDYLHKHHSFLRQDCKMWDANNNVIEFNDK